jgi:hypothetical protein
MSTLGRHLANTPFDFANLEGVTDPKIFDREVQKSVRENIQAGGFMSPTEGITKPVDEDQDNEGFFGSMISKMFDHSGPEAFDTPENKYSDRRFDFISAESNYTETVRKDALSRDKIGFDFNLSSPDLREMAGQVLNKSEAEIDAIAKGTSGISSRDAEVLYQARVSRAESFIKEKFSGSTLAANQRISLVSLAYQNESLIGPKLTKAIQTGNWQGAADEIRNRSNKYKNKGIAERRNREADLFMSYQKPKVAPEDDGFDLGSIFGFGQATPKPPVEPETPAFTENQAVKKVRAQAPEMGKETINPILGMVPSHVRMLIEDVAMNTFGINQNDTIKTSDFFNDDELGAMINIVKRSAQQQPGTKGAVGYETYDKGFSDVAWTSNELGVTGQNPEETVKKTLGQFTWEVNAEGDTIVTDKYNFNDAKALQEQYPGGWDKALHLMSMTGKLFNKEVIDEMAEAPMGLYGIVRRAAALYGSEEGEGAEFKINLGKIDITQA